MHMCNEVLVTLGAGRGWVAHSTAKGLVAHSAC